MTIFERLQPHFPKMKGEVADLVAHLCATMPITDALTIPAPKIVHHAKGVLRATRYFHWDMPREIMLDYVLPYRVNDELFEPYIDLFFEELCPILKGLTMEQAVLAVNYWCLSKATYRSTDDRTMGALSTYTTGYGRCGEESVFTVCALRSVGIPARQCYVPYWAHCDDNHAWVEVYVDGAWRFMGACEPEEQLDIGWFNHAASKAPIVRHRRLGHQGTTTTADENRLYDTVATTQQYAKTATLSVVAEPRTPVGIYLINYCRPALICQKLCDETGNAAFTLGHGTYLVLAGDENGYDMASVTLQEDCSISLNLGRSPALVEFDLIPACGSLPPHTPKPSQDHIDKVAKANRLRTVSHNFVDSIPHKLLDDRSGYTATQKSRFSACLSPKDRKDISDAAADDAATSFAFQGQECDGFFDKFILNPRVENEPLLPHRAYVRKTLSHLSSPQQVWKHLLLTCATVDSQAYPGLCGSLVGALEQRVVTTHSLPIHYVQICRALGFAARLNPVDRSPEFFDGKDFVSLFTQDDKTETITLQRQEGVGATFGETLSLCSFSNGQFAPLNLSGSPDQVPVKPGLYALTHAMRQIDGSVTGRLYFLPAGATAVLLPLADKTAEKLVQADLSHCGLDLSGKCLLAFIEAASEPTEHFLNELMEHPKALTDVRVLLLAETPASNPTLQAVLEAGLATLQCQNFDLVDTLRDCMGVGDHRLPFITAVRDGIGLFSFANYNVGTVKTLLNLLSPK